MLKGLQALNSGVAVQLNSSIIAVNVGTTVYISGRCMGLMVTSKVPVKLKVKVTVWILLIAPLRRKPTSDALIEEMARVVRVSTVLLAHPRIYPRTACTIPLPSQPKLVLILPTAKGWKAEST